MEAIQKASDSTRALDAGLTEILEDYDYRDNVVISALHDQGMEGLMVLASGKGFVAKEEGYVNGCHFCYEARRFLRSLS